MPARATLMLLFFLFAGCHTGAPVAEARPPVEPSAMPVTPAPSACPPLAAPTSQIAVDNPGPGELHEVLELTDSAALWAEAPRDEALELYRREVGARVGGQAGARELILRQRPIYAAISGLEGEAANAAAVLEGRAGQITAIRCLEASLWRRQAARYPMIEHPTELGAFILRRGDKVRVYFSSADRVGQKMRAEVTDRVSADAAAGFEVVAHMHNHPFLFNRVVGDRMWTTEATRDDVAGALAPSMTDVQAWRDMRRGVGLKGAWLTNGLETVRFTADDLDRLVARE